MPSNHDRQTIATSGTGGAARPSGPRLAHAVLLVGLSGCVTTNLDTGKVEPRGDQKLPFAAVEKHAERLQTGMTKVDVHLLLGSPAEKDTENNLWVYLPERYAILIPARALRLEFKDNRLVDFGYRAIVLGTRM